MSNPKELEFTRHGYRVRTLANADYAAGGIALLPEDPVVMTTPGAAGVLACVLPRLSKMAFGATITVWHFGTTNNTTVAPASGDGIVTATSTLTADKDRTTHMALGSHWLLIEDVTT